MISVQGVDVDAAERRVWRDGHEIRLSNKEFQLLHALISRPGQIVSRDVLMREVWQTTFWTSAKTIDVHLGWLRRKLGDDTRRPTLITTIRGQGLRFESAPPAYVEQVTTLRPTPTATAAKTTVATTVGTTTTVGAMPVPVTAAVAGTATSSPAAATAS